MTPTYFWEAQTANFSHRVTTYFPGERQSFSPSRADAKEMHGIGAREQPQGDSTACKCCSGSSKICKPSSQSSCSLLWPC